MCKCQLGRSSNNESRGHKQLFLRARSRCRVAAGAKCEAVESRMLLTSVIVNTALDGLFPPGSGTVSLRNAIATADSSPSSTTITFDRKVFAAQQTIHLGGNQLELSNTSKATTLSGPTPGVTISWDNQAGGLIIDDGVTATLSNIALKNSVGTEAIGGLINHGVLTLSNATISGNASSVGGGVNNYGMATLSNTIISNNTATGTSIVSGGGGGIANSGTLIMTNCTVVGNKSFGGGGGLFNYGGSVKLTDVTISANTATNSDGGGISNLVGGVATVTNSTISGNTASGYGGGGGMYIDGPAMLANVTISGNTALSGSSGGGIDNTIPSRYVTIGNSIVARNGLGGTGGGGSDAYGAFTSSGHNLIGKADGSTGWINGDFAGTAANPVDPKLSQLGNFGGATLTMPPLAGSPAIDHGANALIPTGITTDQRGLPRIANGTVDIGAVEVQTAATAGLISGNILSDINANGKLDTGEKGLIGVKVYIDTNKNGALDSGETSGATDASGNFKFNLPAGTYRIREVLPTGYAITAPAAEYFDVTLKAGQTAGGFAFADAPATASISGRVFNDANGNGLRDPGEMGLGLWQVFIDHNNDGKIDGSDIAITTDINGNWSFKGLIAGTYTVRVVAVAGNVATKPSGGVMSLKLAAAQASTGNLFGEKAIA
jgi:hypothetical protein